MSDAADATESQAVTPGVTPAVTPAVKSDKNPRTLTGTVVSDRMQKTITVLVERRVKHPVYGKYMRRSTKVHAHDEENTCNTGDSVTVVECRPLSKTKTWVLQSIDERASVVE